MLGTGLGRTILYVQVRDGLLSADAVRSGTNYVGLSSSAVVADSWPVVAAAIVFAAVALALALLSRNRHGGGTASRLRIGGNAAIVVGLLGITLVECGLMPYHTGIGRDGRVRRVPLGCPVRCGSLAPARPTGSVPYGNGMPPA